MAPPLESPARHVLSRDLELVRLEVASEDERRFVDEHLASCAECREMAEAVQSHHRAFMAEVLPRTFPNLLARRQRHRRLRAFALVGALALPAAAALLLVARPPEPPEYAIKGGAALRIVARRGERRFEPGPSAPVRAGDQIRFVIEGAHHAYVLIAAIDGAGRASIYLPYEGDRSVPLMPAERVELPGSITLDAAGPERVFAFFSPAPLEAASVRAALTALGRQGSGAIRATARLEVGAAEQTSLLLEKAPD